MVVTNTLGNPNRGVGQEPRKEKQFSLLASIFRNPYASSYMNGFDEADWPRVIEITFALGVHRVLKHSKNLSVDIDFLEELVSSSSSARAKKQSSGGAGKGNNNGNQNQNENPFGTVTKKTNHESRRAAWGAPPNIRPFSVDNTNSNSNSNSNSDAQTRKSNYYQYKAQKNISTTEQRATSSERATRNHSPPSTRKNIESRKSLAYYYPLDDPENPVMMESVYKSDFSPPPEGRKKEIREEMYLRNYYANRTKYLKKKNPKIFRKVTLPSKSEGKMFYTFQPLSESEENPEVPAEDTSFARYHHSGETIPLGRGVDDEDSFHKSTADEQELDTTITDQAETSIADLAEDFYSRDPFNVFRPHMKKSV